MGRTAEQAGLTTRRKVVAWANREMAKLVVSGELRRGSENIANIGGSLQVFSDRLLHRGHCYVIDRDVHASVELDGQILESTRPTLTRMAIGSVLPGSALIVGLALPKKSTDDRRSARFIVVGPRWRIVERLDPDKAPATRSIAAQINAIAGSLARTGAMPPPAAALPTPLEAARQPDTVADQLAKLEKVEELLSRGALSKEQADQIRQRILGD